MAANRGQQFLKPIGNQATDAMYTQCICMLYFFYIRRPNTKVIMMIRNLKDVIVSAYNHHIQKKAKQNYEFYKMHKQILHDRYGK